MKNIIRKSILDKRAALSHEERREASLLMKARLLSHPWFQGSKYVLLFMGYGSEIDTSELIKESLDNGKKVFLPKVCGDVMEFYEIQSLNDLCEGYKGIPEPDGSTMHFVFREEMTRDTMMLMPGVAFDPLGNRIGYGKGFYDKYLAQYPGLQLRTIAVGFRCQLVENIPAEENDIRPCQIILI